MMACLGSNRPYAAARKALHAAVGERVIAVPGMLGMCGSSIAGGGVVDLIRHPGGGVDVRRASTTSTAPGTVSLMELCADGFLSL